MNKIMEVIFHFAMGLWHIGKKFIEEHGRDAIQLTENIKNAVDSDIADTITNIIPGEWDDIALAWARAAVPIACDAVGIIVNCDLEDGPHAYFQCIVDEIRKIDDRKRAGLYRDIAAQIAIAKSTVSGDTVKMRLREVNMAIEMEFNRRQEALQNG